MIGNFFVSALGGILSPRKSVRHIIDTQGGLPVAALLVVLSYLITQILMILTPGSAPLREGDPASMHIFGLIQAFGSFFIVSGLGLLIGRIAGGRATWPEMQLAVAWHAVVTSFLSPPIIRLYAIIKSEMTNKDPQALAEKMSVGMTFPLAMAAGVITVWLLAKYIAEAHRLKSVAGVLGILVIGWLILVAFTLNGLATV